MRAAGLDPRHLAALLQRIEAQAPERFGAVPDFLSSHPSTEEREALAREP
jgi:predicted Zn-dependent protease